MTYEELLTYFHVKRHYQDKAQCTCPAHEDNHASLTITKGQEKILMHCHAGCHTEDILQAAGLTMADLFYEEKSTGSS